MELTIECQARPEGSKPNALRRAGKLPAVLYGHKGSESTSLVVDAKAIELLLRHATVQKSVVQVTVPDLDWSGKAVLQEVHAHPWRGYLYHISFFAVGDQN